MNAAEHRCRSGECSFDSLAGWNSFILQLDAGLFPRSSRRRMELATRSTPVGGCSKTIRWLPPVLKSQSTTSRRELYPVERCPQFDLGPWKQDAHMQVKSGGTRI